jgi:hypothetical protein
MLDRQACSSADPCSGLGGSANGCLSNLKSIGVGDHKMSPEAASHFIKMYSEMPEDVKKKVSVGSSYRPLKTQCDIFDWDYYDSTSTKKRRKKGTSGVPVAMPGTSNHGWGRALDISPRKVQDWIRDNGTKYGWCWGEVKSEPWHFTFCGPGSNKSKVCASICSGVSGGSTSPSTDDESSTETNTGSGSKPITSLTDFFRSAYDTLKSTGMGQKQIQEINEDVDRISEIIKKVL